MLEVFERDLPYRCSWHEATEWCNKLGDGWRLPDVHELRKMLASRTQYKMRGHTYWSLTPGHEEGYVKIMYFKGGAPGWVTNCRKESTGRRVRFVRDVKTVDKSLKDCTL